VSLAAVKAILDVPQDTALQQAALRKLFVSYMTAKPAIVRTQVRVQTCVCTLTVCVNVVRSVNVKCTNSCSYVSVRMYVHAIAILYRMY
jgi:hypothetical protein